MQNSGGLSDDDFTPENSFPTLLPKDPPEISSQGFLSCPDANFSPDDLYSCLLDFLQDKSEYESESHSGKRPLPSEDPPNGNPSPKRLKSSVTDQEGSTTHSTGLLTTPTIPPTPPCEASPEAKFVAAFQTSISPSSSASLVSLAHRTFNTLHDPNDLATKLQSVLPPRECSQTEVIIRDPRMLLSKVDIAVQRFLHAGRSARQVDRDICQTFLNLPYWKHELAKDRRHVYMAFIFMLCVCLLRKRDEPSQRALHEARCEVELHALLDGSALSTCQTALELGRKISFPEMLNCYVFLSYLKTFVRVKDHTEVYALIASCLSGDGKYYQHGGRMDNKALCLKELICAIGKAQGAQSQV